MASVPLSRAQTADALITQLKGKLNLRRLPPIRDLQLEANILQTIKDEPDGQLIAGKIGDLYFKHFNQRLPSDLDKIVSGIHRNAWKVDSSMAHFKDISIERDQDVFQIIDKELALVQERITARGGKAPAKAPVSDVQPQATVQPVQPSQPTPPPVIVESAEMKELRELRAKAAADAKEIAELKAALEAEKRAREEALEKADTAEKQVVHKDKELHTARDEILQLTDENTQLGKDLKAALAKVSDLEKEIALQRHVIADKDKELLQKDQEIKQLKEEIENLQKTIQQLQAAVSKAQIDLGAEQQAKAAAVTEAASAKAQLAVVQAENGTLKAENGKLKGENGTLSGELNAEKQGRKADAVAAQATLDAQKKAHAADQAALAAAKASNASVQAQLVAAQKDLGTERSGRNDDATAAKTALEAQKNARAAAEATLTSAQTQLEAEKSRVATLTVQLEAERKALAAKQVEWETKFKASEAAKDTMRKHLESKDLELKRFQDKLKTALVENNVSLTKATPALKSLLPP